MSMRPKSDPRLFRLPPGDSRTTLIGATGTGKSTAGGWFLANARLDVRPWVVIDFKREELFDMVGFPPLRTLTLKQSLGKRDKGVFIVSPTPGDEDALEEFLWRLWKRGNAGLFVDEASLMPDKAAWRAILQQGRSKRIPVIACTQRPVDVKRAVFSEASFFGVWRLQDRRDYQVVRGFVPADLDNPLPEHHWRWYDVARNNLLDLSPVPDKPQVADMLRDRVPRPNPILGGFFRPLPQQQRSL